MMHWLRAILRRWQERTIARRELKLIGMRMRWELDRLDKQAKQEGFVFVEQEAFCDLCKSICGQCGNGLRMMAFTEERALIVARGKGESARMENYLR
jgi:hypothetical protein